MKFFKSILFTVILSIWQLNATFAQCAMCRATVENNISSGESTVGAGLNTGILYLMVMPYILIAVIGYLWYKNSKKRQAERLRINQALEGKV